MSSNTDQQQIATASSFRINWTRRLIVLVTIIAALVLAWIILNALSRISNALLVVLISALLAYMIYPFSQLVQRRLPRPLAIAIAYLIVIAALAAILYFATSSLLAQSVSFIQTVQSLFSPQGQHLPQPVLNVLNQFGISQQQVDLYRHQILSQAQSFLSGIVPLLMGIFSNFITSIIIITLSIYFLVDGPRIVRWLRSKTPAAQHDIINFMLNTLDRSVGGYFHGLFLLATIGAVCTGIVLTLLHVPYAILLSLLFFLLFFIPIIGGYVSGALCILAAIPQGWLTVIVVFIFTFLLQQIVLGQILAPRIFNHSIGLHPIVALFALLAGGQLFGPLGGFFSVPLAGVIQEVITAYWKRWEQKHPQQFQLHENQTLTQPPIPKKLDYIPPSGT